MADQTVVYKVKERELPKVLKQSYDFNNMNEKQARSFHNRLRYIEEITLKVDEWLAAVNSLEEHQAFIDVIELDLSINLSIRSDSEKEVSFWLVHSTWTSEATAREMKAALDQNVLALLDRSIPSANCAVSEFRAALATWNEGIKLVLDRFYSAGTLAEAIAFYIVINVVLANMLATVFKSRLNESAYDRVKSFYETTE